MALAGGVQVRRRDRGVASAPRRVSRSLADQRLRQAQRDGDDERRWVEEERAGVYRRWAVCHRDRGTWLATVQATVQVTRWDYSVHFPVAVPGGWVIRWGNRKFADMLLRGWGGFREVEFGGTRVVTRVPTQA